MRAGAAAGAGGFHGDGAGIVRLVPYSAAGWAGEKSPPILPEVSMLPNTGRLGGAAMETSVRGGPNADQGAAAASSAAGGGFFGE